MWPQNVEQGWAPVGLHEGSKRHVTRQIATFQQVSALGLDALIIRRSEVRVLPAPRALSHVRDHVGPPPRQSSALLGSNVAAERRATMSPGQDSSVRRSSGSSHHASVRYAGPEMAEARFRVAN